MANMNMSDIQASLAYAREHGLSVYASLAPEYVIRLADVRVDPQGHTQVRSLTTGAWIPLSAVRCLFYQDPHLDLLA